MPGDVQLTALQTRAAPLTYTVPGSALVRVKSIHAQFRDDGAGGDWLPAVQLVSDSGHIIATASDQGAKVTAGGDADASFFPGVKHAAASSTDVNDLQSQPGGLWLDVANLGDAAFPVGAGVTTAITFPQGIWDGTVLDGSASDGIDLLVSAAFSAGVPHSTEYLISLSVLWENANFPRAAWIDMPLQQQVSQNGPQYADYHVRSPAGAFTTSNPTGLGPLWCRDFAIANPKANAVPLTVQAMVTNGDAASRNIVAAYLWVYATGYDFF